MADHPNIVVANPFPAMLLLAIRAMLKSKTFMLRSVWPFPKLTPLMGFWQLQLFLLGVALAISGMFWLLQGNTNPTPQFLFTFIIGNFTWLAVTLSAPVLLKQKSPWDWFAYLAVLLPVAAVASSMASVASRIVAGRTDHLLQLDWFDIRNGYVFLAGHRSFHLYFGKGEGAA